MIEFSQNLLSFSMQQQSLCMLKFSSPCLKCRCKLQICSDGLMFHSGGVIGVFLIMCNMFLALQLSPACSGAVNLPFQGDDSHGFHRHTHSEQQSRYMSSPPPVSSLDAASIGFIIIIDRRKDKWSSVKASLSRIAVSSLRHLSPFKYVHVSKNINIKNCKQANNMSCNQKSHQQRSFGKGMYLESLQYSYMFYVDSMCDY